MRQQAKSLDLELVVISLSSAHERRQRAMSQLKQLSLPWSIFDARTEPPAGLPYRAADALRQRGRPLRPGELGAFGSHLACLHDFLENSSARYRLVIEDDVFLDPGFPYARLPAFMSGCGIEYLRLHWTFIKPYVLVAHLGKYRQLLRFRAPCFGACAYVISRAGAEQLLRSITAVVRPIDDEMDRFWINGLPLYAIHPSPALEFFGPSTLGRDDALPAASVAVRGRYFMHRVGERLKRGLCNLRLRRQDRLIARRLRALPLEQTI